MKCITNAKTKNTKNKKVWSVLKRHLALVLAGTLGLAPRLPGSKPDELTAVLHP